MSVTRDLFEPIAQHNWFQKVGRGFHGVTLTAASLDLPDDFDVPAGRPVILAGNHRSLLDFPVAMAFFARFGVSARIQIQAAYMKKGPGAKLLHSVGAIPTSRAHRQSSERASIETLERGQLLALMPEGRLCRPEEWVRGVGPGKPGLSRIALATEALIVPVGVSGTERVWPRDGAPRWRLPRSTIRVRVGEPFELASSDHSDNAVQVMQAISDVLVEMGDEPALRDADARR